MYDVLFVKEFGMSTFNDRDFSMFSGTARPHMLDKSTESHNNAMVGAKTAQYMIQCEQLYFSSAIKEQPADDKVKVNPDTAAPCLWFEVGTSRLNTYDTSGELYGDGRVVAKCPIVCMKYGAWAPVIQEYLYKGMCIDEINIYRLQSAEGTTRIIQQLNFKNSVVTVYEQFGDTIVFSFSYVLLQDVCDIFEFNSKKGRSGVYATTINYAEMTVKEQ